MPELIYPTLDVFLYQLRNGLGDSDTQIQENHEEFWKNIPNLKIELEKESAANNPEYIKLLDLLEPAEQQNLNIKFNSRLFQKAVAPYKLEGYYYPVRFDDTYALRFDCSIDDKINPTPVSCFQTLAQEAANKTGNIGKTWMISGSLPLDCQDDIKALAQAAGKALIPGDYAELETGKFLGASVFEMWKSPQKWENVETENTHVVIFLFPNLQTMKKAAGFYGDWLGLFYARNKILWEYAYSQQITKTLKAEFQKITEVINKFKQLYPSDSNSKKSGNQLSELQEILSKSISILSEYITKISYLEILISAIETNLKAYDKYYENIVIKAKKLQQEETFIGDTNLEFLTQFSQLARNKYKIQIEQDKTSLSAGIRIIEDLINTIRGIVEIEQAKRDRNLEKTIGIAGVGLATSQIASAAILAQLPDKPTPPSYKIYVFVVSLLIGAIASVLAYKAYKLLQKPPH